jgi:hypothetical protein
MRAKFTVFSETHYSYGSVNYKLNPVTTGSPENEEFFRTTPAGTIEVNIKEGTTPARLKLGADYYIDFTEVT